LKKELERWWKVLEARNEFSESGKSQRILGAITETSDNCIITSDSGSSAIGLHG
jgi:hypothetical protein